MNIPPHVKKIFEQFKGKSVIACMPVDWENLKNAIPDFEGYMPPPGAIQQPCAACKYAMWVGPASQKQKALTPEIPYLCYECAFLCKIINDPDNDIPMVPLTKKSGQYFFKPGSKMDKEINS